MATNKKRITFFLGANTPHGFISKFNTLADQKTGWRYFVIKGTPGSGKSTLLKKIAYVFEDRYQNTEFINCATDINSLDAVIIPKLKLAVADGSAPHTVNPRYPGAFESIINMSDNLDENALFQHREEIKKYYDKSSDLQSLCCRFLASASAVMQDTYQVAYEHTNFKKINQYAKRLCQKELKTSKKGTGYESVRFLSAVTNEGHMVHYGTLPALAEHVYFLEDEYGVFSRELLSHIRSEALHAGYDITSCYCPLSPFDKLEHLFIPELSLAFTTVNRFHTPDNISPYKVVNSRRFTDLEKVKDHKRRLALNRRIASQMISEASKVMKEAHDTHIKLEEIYINHKTEDHSGSITAKTIDKIESIAATYDNVLKNR